MKYRSIWRDKETRELMISTTNKDGSFRTIDEMEDVLKAYFKFHRDSSELHSWSGNAIHGTTCRKCGTWVNTWHTLPDRGCIPARPELSTALRSNT